MPDAQEDHSLCCSWKDDARFQKDFAQVVGKLFGPGA